MIHYGPSQPMDSGRIWLIFLLRGTFYCCFIPLWEGFDEWGH